MAKFAFPSLRYLDFPLYNEDVENGDGIPEKAQTLSEQIAAAAGAVDPADENFFNRGRLARDDGGNATAAFAMLPETRELLTAFFEEFWERTDLGEWWS